METIGLSSDAYSPGILFIFGTLLTHLFLQNLSFILKYIPLNYEH
jgi:hypothetical protein